MLKRTMFRDFFLLICFLFCAETTLAQVQVSGHTQRNGRYVQPHYRTAPDGIFRNNWSTKGNTNPYTGKGGTLTHRPGSTAGSHRSSSYSSTSNSKASKTSSAKLDFSAYSFLNLDYLKKNQTSPAQLSDIQHLFDTREWTDATGEFRVIARFLEINSGIVRLKKPNGSNVLVQFDQLSRHDRHIVSNYVLNNNP